MSGGPLPPVPDLIPISALLKTPVNNNSGPRRECAPCAEVMGEQRSRRPGRQPSVDLIDSAQSRGPSAAPRTPPPQQQSRKHRKSDRRRREHRKPPARTRSGSKHSSKSREASTPASSPERPPRVNPIFVWVRQEDTRIVDVKCEDYDKRNRILLTKTAQGWRAIPRTETLVPSLKEAADRHHHHHHRHRKARKSKVRRRSAAVQVDTDIDIDDELETDDHRPTSPTWTSPVNVESHLPSHKIHVPQKCPSPATDGPGSVNSAVSDSAHGQDQKCSDVSSPLDNLLAVAEFEFNQHMQSGEWNNKTHVTNDEEEDDIIDDDDDDQKEFISNMEQLTNLIDSCSKNDDQNSCGTQEPKSEDCDYNEEDDNNIAMDDILSRLEQSLRSPEEHADYNTKIEEEIKAEDAELQQLLDDDDDDNIVESSTTIEEEPTDLSIKPVYTPDNNECSEQPTDLTVPRNTSSPVRALTPRPPSQNSEAIQSPQPSGIPAVPPSPDIVSTSANNNNNNNYKNKSVFLETLLTSATATPTTPTPQNQNEKITTSEPLDLGVTSRKSASPTITCSEEEVKNKHNVSSESEPPAKKFKPEDITLKNLLDADAKSTSSSEEIKTSEKIPETPRLLELLKTDLTGPDPLTQLRQILYDTNLNVPDPMLVPKERLSQIISNPGREIPRLLKQRPELRLPEALAFPHLLQDPEILVITLQQLETIILKQNQSLSLKDLKLASPEVKQSVAKPLSKKPEKSDNNKSKKSDDHKVVDSNNKGFNELASDIDAATTAAFNQMIWLPYLNHLEAMSFGGNPEVMKMLSNSVPMYPGQVPDLNHVNRFPVPHQINFPMQQPHLNYNNPSSLELSMWQEAMMQANMLRPKIPSYEGLNPKNSFRDYLDKLNFANSKAASTGISTNNSKLPSSSHVSNNNNNKASLYPTPFQNSFLNLPTTPSAYQGNSSKHQQHQPYNNFFGQKSLSQKSSHAYLPKRYHQEKTSLQQQHHHVQKPKLSCKPFASASFSKEKSSASASGDFSKQHHQPIDLSGSTAPASKLKVKQHLIDPVNAPKLLKHGDDIPEVGSTTASVEEMQDAHKHLWHPLFGNQKSYHSPWNWTTVTATGE